jgi:hypothetical protein
MFLLSHNRVLTLELTRLIEGRGKHWVSELEISRHIQWVGQRRRVDEVAAELRRRTGMSTMPMLRRKSYWKVNEMKKVVHLKRGDAYETLFCGGRLLNGPAYCVA